MSLAEMMKRMKALIGEARALNVPDPSEDQTAELKAKMAEIENLKRSIETEEALALEEGRFKPGPAAAGAGDPNDGARGSEGFGTFGEMLRAVVTAARGGGEIDKRLVRAAGLSEGVPADGGFLVQTDFSRDLLKRTYETGILSSRVRRIPVSAAANGLKINAIDEDSRATGSRLGGVVAYWLNEAGLKTASQPKFRQMELSLKKLIGLCYATDELLQDTAALEAIISEAFAEEIGFQVDDSIFRGTGAGQPLGILNAGSLITVAAEAAQAADTVVAENIINMWSRLYAKSRPNSVWYYNQEIEPQLHTMSLAVGTGGIPVFMPANGLSGSPYATIYGRPAIPIEQASALGDVGDIVLADLSQYLMIDKGGIQGASSIHVRFVYDETAFRFVYRVDGQPTWNKTLTPYKGSKTLSPFVALASR